MNFLPHTSSRFLRLSFSIVFAALIVSFSVNSLSAQRDTRMPDDPKCLSPSAIMERETNEYIKKNNIRLKSSLSKFYSNADK